MCWLGQVQVSVDVNRKWVPVVWLADEQRSSGR